MPYPWIEYSVIVTEICRVFEDLFVSYTFKKVKSFVVSLNHESVNETILLKILSTR